VFEDWPEDHDYASCLIKLLAIFDMKGNGSFPSILDLKRFRNSPINVWLLPICLFMGLESQFV
jgi:hypothetical protein